MSDKKMPMAKDPETGKMIPEFAMDGVGKMKVGGMIEKTVSPRVAKFKEMERRGYGAARKPQ